MTIPSAGGPRAAPHLLSPGGLVWPVRAACALVSAKNNNNIIIIIIIIILILIIIIIIII